MRPGDQCLGQAGPRRKGYDSAPAFPRDDAKPSHGARSAARSHQDRGVRVVASRPHLFNTRWKNSSVAGSATLIAPISAPSPIVLCAVELYAGQFGRPAPFGSPVAAKLTQYDDIVSDTFLSTGS